MSSVELSNRAARWVWLERHGLAEAPTGSADLEALITNLGFVQLDSIRHVERAQDHIIWSRSQTYRPGGLEKLLRKRALFEHFTHDASLLPMPLLPMWQRQFDRMAKKMSKAGWWVGLPEAEERALIRERIAREGALCTKDFESAGERPKEMWHRPAHKKALDFMWYAGELATCHREKFVKYYDLAERVFPEALQSEKMSDAEQIDALCMGALERLGFGTAGEIQRFWDACSSAEVRGWIAKNKRQLVPVRVKTAQKGWREGWALESSLPRLQHPPKPTARLRIINPFDPAFRDRARTEALFGFAYRNEIFVPAEKRQYGYYVYPILEGDKLVGRTLLRPDRAAGRLHVEKIWPEDGIKWNGGRQARFVAELARFARFAGLAPGP